MDDRRPDWQQANPVAIARALEHASAKPTGGWSVLGASRTLARRGRPVAAIVGGLELVLWRPRGGALVAAPAACPHMGAHLASGHVGASGCVVCPWHGLELPGDRDRRVPGQGRWQALPVHDDGVLTWVQADPGAAGATEAPIIAARPARFLDGVVRRDAACEPRDVIANRLDPWHGVHFHPYAFRGLRVVGATDEAIDLVVGYRLAGRITFEVGARFHCPDAHTIVMTITEGEGTGSVVETHATPLVRAAPGQQPRTAVIEATLATSDRPGFVHADKGAVVVRPLIRMMAGRLWRDDARYAERTYDLRRR